MLPQGVRQRNARPVSAGAGRDFPGAEGNGLLEEELHRLF